MIYLGADHRGFELKEKIKSWLADWGYQFEDLGNAVFDKTDDYPDFASAVARKVSENPEENRGILLCGSGVGVDITANKFKGVRSALVWSDDEELVKQSRSHDNSNVLSLPADHLMDKQTQKIVKLWLETPFSEEERHVRRLKKIAGLLRS
ncbi:MAG: ribose 5-phosphate isomerase B [Patescibacteria group bacterium]|nr:MAG: ribose 5-phosphate isomerase B [Patescibacteria group bacterium]